MTPTIPHVSALPRGHALVPATFTLDVARKEAYLAATGDSNDYGEALPPLAVLALGLQALQEQIALPEGSLHTGQEIVHTGPLRPGEELTLTGRIAQRSERQGYVISVIELNVAGADGRIDARTTIMAPAAAA